MHQSMVTVLASISGSLGALLAVTVIICGILFVVIVVISRQRGMQCPHFHYSGESLSVQLHVNN